MNKTITIKPGRMGRYDDVSPFIIAEELRLEFDGLIAANGDYCVEVKLNAKERSFKLNSEKAVTLEQDFFEAGELNVSVLYYLRGEKLAEYVIEPLAVKETTTDLSAVPVISALTAQLELFGKESEELKQTLTEENKRLQDEISGLAALVAELTKRVDLIEGGYDPLQV